MTMLKSGMQPDCDLLKAFAEARDEAAFEAVVRRHGGYVFQLCRRILGQTQDAEDALQATFLVLAREAPTLTKHPCLSAWLHRVAHGIAVDAVRARKARARREEGLARMVAADPEPKALSDEQASVLHAELNALPEKYRVPLVMFHLEGCSLEQTAEALHCPSPTAWTRLARGREKLAERLRRRGLLLSLASLTSLLSAEAGAAELPASLVMSTAKAATLFVAGTPASLSTPAGAMAKGAMKMMLIAKVKLALLVLLAIGGLGFGSALMLAQAEEPAKTPAATAADPTPDKSAETTLQLMLVSAKKEYAKGETVELTLVFKNNTKAELVLLRPVGPRPANSCLSASVTRPGGKVETLALSSSAGPDKPGGISHGGWDNDYVVLKPGAEHREGLALKSLKLEASGEYTLKLTYDSTNEPFGPKSQLNPSRRWKGRLESSALTFRVN